ncbi:MAG: DUF6485 family protein [archaeon]
MECQKAKNLKKCNCTYSGCARKGMCCECIRYHWERGELPACFFSKEAEAGFDRSIKAFVEENRQ